MTITYDYIHKTILFFLFIICILMQIFLFTYRNKCTNAYSDLKSVVFDTRQSYLSLSRVINDNVVYIESFKYIEEELANIYNEILYAELLINSCNRGCEDIVYRHITQSLESQVSLLKFILSESTKVKRKIDNEEKNI